MHLYLEINDLFSRSFLFRLPVLWMKLRGEPILNWQKLVEAFCLNREPCWRGNGVGWGSPLLSCKYPQAICLSDFWSGSLCKIEASHLCLRKTGASELLPWGKILLHVSLFIWTGKIIHHFSVPWVRIPFHQCHTQNKLPPFTFFSLSTLSSRLLSRKQQHVQWLTTARVPKKTTLFKWIIVWSCSHTWEQVVVVLSLWHLDVIYPDLFFLG